MPLCAYNYNFSTAHRGEPLDYPRPLVAASPKPVQAAAAAYDKAVTRWRDAETALADLRRAATDEDAEASQAAIEAVREGRPVPASKLDGITGAIAGAERAEYAAYLLAREAEEELLDAITAHEDAIVAAAEQLAEDAMHGLCEGIADALAKYLPAYRAAFGAWGWTSHPGSDTSDSEPTVRMQGQNTTPAALISAALDGITRATPTYRSTYREYKALQHSPSVSDHHRAAQLFTGWPRPKWATVLEVAFP